jgi:predicted nucleotidyltransferase
MNSTYLFYIIFQNKASTISAAEKKSVAAHSVRHNTGGKDMRTVGIICEYNPFHNGHLRQLRLARELAGEDCAIVCLMSGNYVQRGEPAIFPKPLRAEAALRCGADLVLELPLTVALSSAEGFAAGGVSILTALGCDDLCYGIESDDNNIIMSIAKANLDPAFDALLRAELTTGCSYPAARQHALEKLIKTETPVGADAHIGPPSENHQPSILSNPNDLLAVEYCKAILKQKSRLRPMPVRRTGSYHAEALDPEAPSATALRAALRSDTFQSCHCEASANTGRGNPYPPSPDWRTAVPSEVKDLYESAPIHTMQAGERAVLAVLRTLPDAAFQALPFGSEGLWSKFMKNCRSCASVEEIVDATKSKRYTRSRIQRMLLCAFLGLTAADLERHPPYVRVLGFTDRGRAILRTRKTRSETESDSGPLLINAGETPPDPAYYDLETRAADLYTLFSEAPPRPAGEEGRLRVRWI